MRKIVCLATLLAVAAVGGARAEDKPDLTKVIDKAIKASGGEEKLAKVKAFTFKMKGKFYGMGEEGVPYTGDVSVQLPDKSRMQIDGEDNGKKVTFFVQVVNGDKVWETLVDKTEEIKDKAKINEVKEDRFAERVNTLLPLVKDKGFKLEPLGDVKVDGKPAVGIRVTHKGHRDINLFFNKDSGLLVKTERTVKDEMADKEVTQETLYSDYKDYDGVKQPTKMVMNRDGKKYVTATISDYEVKDKLDDALFSKP